MTNKKLAEPDRPVSVIIPVRNAAASICSTLQSLDQDRDVIYEILLIDDGSSHVSGPLSAGGLATCSSSFSKAARSGLFVCLP